MIVVDKGQITITENDKVRVLQETLHFISNLRELLDLDDIEIDRLCLAIPLLLKNKNTEELETEFIKKNAEDFTNSLLNDIGIKRIKVRK